MWLENQDDGMAKADSVEQSSWCVQKKGQSRPNGDTAAQDVIRTESEDEE